MPSPLTSSFASAAANNTQDGRRAESGQDWLVTPRVTLVVVACIVKPCFLVQCQKIGIDHKDLEFQRLKRAFYPANVQVYGRSRNRANGATQTFRRASQATNASSNRDGNQSGQGTSSSHSAVYVPPHMNATNQTASLRNGSTGEVRYTKEHLVELYKQQRESETLDQNISAIFTAGWNPLGGQENANSGWGRREEGKDASVGPEICWHYNAEIHPLALTQMTDEERELFSSSVNSPIKIPQNSAKDNTGNSTSGRRTSNSFPQNHAGASNNISTGQGRGPLRRRDTSDSYNVNNPLSPSGGGRFFRDEPNAANPPASLLRRKTDYREGTNDTGLDDRDKDPSAREGREETGGPFGSLKRSTTGPLSTGLNGPSSPWAVGLPGGGIGSMGTFGSFAIGPSTVTNDASEPWSGFGNSRGESRFKGLLAKSSAEDITSVAKKSSLGNLQRLPEVDDDSTYRHWEDQLRNRPGRSDTNPYGDQLARTGSAALVGAQDNSQGIDQQANSSVFGLPTVTGSRDVMQASTSQDLSFHQTLQSHHRGQEPMSPTGTNPYQSPEVGRSDVNQEPVYQLMHQRAAFGFGGRDEPASGVFGSMPKGVSSAMDDRSQNSSAGAGRSFSGLAGLGGFPAFGGSAWSGIACASSKERGGFPSGFGDPVFGTADLQPPNVAGLGSNNLFTSPSGQTSGLVNRSSRLDALFPQGAQDQIRVPKAGPDGSDRQADFATRSRGISGLDGSFIRGDQETLRSTSGLFADSRSQESALRSIQGVEETGFADGRGPSGQLSGLAPLQNPVTSPGMAQATSSALSGELGVAAGQNLNPSQPNDMPPSSQLPPAQQRQMVMPDRMRWIYRDPSGLTQGPWSGLEMHDWFKAGFFTAELQVKKLEDVEYEPLAQLVRRIGNSREPFLVPQIGVPHGVAAPSQGNQWASPSTSSVVGTGPPQTGAAQPPFASSFPSFGTTLTAEQQNALERRKQEEQYLMARQKEHLAQQQVLLKQMQLQGGPHSLHSLQHHSSAHSLHSQPSFGSITSPTGYQPSPVQGPIQPPQTGPGLMEGSMRQPPPSQFGGDFRGGREDELLPSLLDRMSVSRGAPFPFTSGSFPVQHDNGLPPPQVSAMLQDRARLQVEQRQQQVDSMEQNDTFRERQTFDERHEEFNALRSQVPDNDVIVKTDLAAMQSRERMIDHHTQEQQFKPLGIPEYDSVDTEGLSISQQVQNTTAAIGQRSASGLEGNVWSKQETGASSPLPPAPSTSPLPAPSAQRNRQNFADSLVDGFHSESQTPVDTPSASVAPWAEKTAEGTKGPSLRQIQEAEARKAAQQEEMAAASRKVQNEQERSIQPVPPAPGLPSTANWASGGTSTTPTNSSANVWAERAVAKTVSSNTSAATKKTLAQIQREEETRKQRQAAAGNQRSTSNVGLAPGGKRYADLASKAAATTPAAPSPPTGAWTTVGSGGKAKAPSAVVAMPQASGRAAAASTPAAPPAAARVRPTVQTRPPTTTPTTTTTATATNHNKAAEDFTRWAKTALAKGLNNNINVDDFVQSLVLLPAESEIISDSIYANSQILDGHRFADEFLRRRKLADKGLLQDGTTNMSNSAPTTATINTPTNNRATANSAGAGGIDGGGGGGGGGLGGRGAGGGGSDGAGGGGGWSEVAKKGPSSHHHGSNSHKDESGGANAAFKVVAPKKKGKR